MNPMVKNFCVVILFLWFFAYAANGYRLPLQRQIDDEIDCNVPGVTNKTECLIIMSHPIIQSSYQKLRHARSACDSNQPSLICPHMNTTYLSTTLENGHRSLSPYDFHCDYDENRMPRYLYQAYCLCSFCIDPETRKEGSNYNSKPLIITINVLRRHKNGPYKPRKEKYTVGCTCVLPRQTQS